MFKKRDKTEISACISHQRKNKWFFSIITQTFIQTMQKWTGQSFAITRTGHSHSKQNPTASLSKQREFAP